ncbi:hypothetical protein M9H77_04580 [Catharanthus roseus]|uniref:Uncharacterized protein n=1 Tax=Catharanthus roseus TaxID=4058 RepID=A0ACC0CET6_CATRO|nr:hypothetical protein M9H77_04580 [Catharanthus roseus]
MFQHPNSSLLSSFVERWQPDTNSFHMPWGEMTITLHDVELILGVPSYGNVADHYYSQEQIIAVIQSDLDISDSSIGINAQNLAGVADSPRSGLSTEQRAACYVLYLLGSSFFTDKSGNNFPGKLWSLVKNVSSLGGFTWGAATLPYLYRSLGQASRADAKKVSGCWSLLEAWIYLYFPMFAPPVRAGARLCKPYIQRFAMLGHKMENKLIDLRIRLDTMITDEVRYTPYRSDEIIDV